MRLWIMGIFCVLMVTSVWAEPKEEPKTVIVTGKLVKIVAIGGETTGWAVDLDSPIEVNGEKLNRIEIDPKEKKIDGFKDKRVEVTGTLEKRYGIERGEYWVIVFQKIRELNN